MRPYRPSLDPPLTADLPQTRIVMVSFMSQKQRNIFLYFKVLLIIPTHTVMSNDQHQCTIEIYHNTRKMNITLKLLIPSSKDLSWLYNNKLLCNNQVSLDSIL